MNARDDPLNLESCFKFQVQYIGDTNGSKHGFKLNELQHKLRRRSIPCPARK